MVSSPTPEEQLRFLTNIQRVLSEGQFVATYKYALLLALADLSVEQGDDSGESLPLALENIAEKFIQYYWRQAAPYPGAGDPEVLLQNTGGQAAIINRLIEARSLSVASLAEARAREPEWSCLVRDVARTVKTMPLWKLQTLGRQAVPFLYDNHLNRGNIVLKAGVAFNLRRFYDLLRNLIEGAWIRDVRMIRKNQSLLGEASDLSEFMFGSERANLAACGRVLGEFQNHECFYCQKRLTGPSDVDHFVPWSRYPVDLGHNFVLAHAGCNRAKRDYLADVPHLERWATRNARYGKELTASFHRIGMTCNAEVSRQVTRWAYEQAQAAGAQVWRRDREVVLLSGEWRELLAA